MQQHLPNPLYPLATWLQGRLRGTAILGSEFGAPLPAPLRIGALGGGCAASADRGAARPLGPLRARGHGAVVIARRRLMRGVGARRRLMRDTAALPHDLSAMVAAPGGRGIQRARASCRCALKRWVRTAGRAAAAVVAAARRAADTGHWAGPCAAVAACEAPTLGSGRAAPTGLLLRDAVRHRVARSAAAARRQQTEARRDR